jgi:hypothetical protein
MIIKEINTHIKCSECGYTFVYRLLIMHDKFENLHNVFRHYTNECPTCAGNKTHIKKAIYRVASIGIKYKVGWQCSKCMEKWSEYQCINVEKIAAGKTTTGNIATYLRENSIQHCPNKKCSCTNKNLISFSKE